MLEPFAPLTGVVVRLNRKVFLLLVPILLVSIVFLGANTPQVHAVTGNWIIAAQPTQQCITLGLCRAGSPAVTFPSGQGGASLVQMNVTGGFTGTITLSTVVTPSTGLTVACNPSSVAIGPANGASTCSYTSTAPAAYSVVITGTNGTASGTHSVTVPVTVVSFTLGVAPSTTSFNSGTQGAATVTLVNSGINETVALSASSVPASGLTVDFADFVIGATTATAINGTTPVASTITIAAVHGFTGAVALSDTVPQGLTCSAISPASITTAGTATLSCSSVKRQAFSVPITGTSGVLTRTVIAAFNFTIGAEYNIVATSPAAVNAGISASSTITVSAVNGFTGVVVLDDTVPAGLTCGAITPATITGSGSATVSCSAATGGNTFTLGIRGNATRLIHVAPAFFTVNGAPTVALNAKIATSASSAVRFSSSSPNVYNVTITGTPPTGPTFSINTIVNVQGYTISPSPNSFTSYPCLCHVGCGRYSDFFHGSHPWNTGSRERHDCCNRKLASDWWHDESCCWRSCPGYR